MLVGAQMQLLYACMHHCNPFSGWARRNHRSLNLAITLVLGFGNGAKIALAVIPGEMIDVIYFGTFTKQTMKPHGWGIPRTAPTTQRHVRLEVKITRPALDVPEVGQHLWSILGVNQNRFLPPPCTVYQ